MGEDEPVVEAEWVPAGERVPATVQEALVRVEETPKGEGAVLSVFENVKATIAALPNTVKAIELRDGYRAVEAAGRLLKRYDIEAAAARSVAEVEQWIALRNPPKPPGRPRKAAGPDNPLSSITDSSGGDAEAASAAGPSGEPVSASELRQIRMAHPDPADDAALAARMDRIEERGGKVSRRALREEVRQEQEGEAAPEAESGATLSEAGPKAATPQPAPAPRPITLHACTVDAVSQRLGRGSVDAVVVTLPRRAVYDACLDLAEHVLRASGLLFIACSPVKLPAAVDRARQPPVDDADRILQYRTTLSCARGTSWHPVLVLSHGETDRTRGRTAFESANDRDGWRQLLGAWLPADSLVCDPCCGDGASLVGADAAGMRIVGAEATQERVEAVRAAIERARAARAGGAGAPDTTER